MIHYPHKKKLKNYLQNNLLIYIIRVNMDKFDTSFTSLLETDNIYMIKVLFENNLVNINEAAQIINTHYDKNFSGRISFTMELADFLISIDVDESVLQPLLINIICNYKYIKYDTGPFIKKYICAIRNLLAYGVTIPPDPFVVALLADELIIDYISANDHVVDTQLELECAKQQSLIIVQQVQNILINKNMRTTEPVILFVEAYRSNNSVFIEQCIQTMDFTDPVISLIIILCISVSIPKKYQVYLHPDVIKYGIRSIIDYFHGEPVKKFGYIKCENHEAITICNNTYTAIIQKASFLLDVLVTDARMN